MLLWDATLRRHRIATSLLLRDVILVRKSLLLLEWHITRMHLWVALWDTGAVLLWWEVLWSRLFWRLYRILVIDAILAVACRFGRIQASLG